MVNHNGKITSQTNISIEQNRAFLYGDAVFETLKTLDGKVLFAEDHYFRLMSSMRILRMEIPVFFTQEYLEQQISSLLDTFEENHSSYRIRITCYRQSGGKYTPENRGIDYIITAEPLPNAAYAINNGHYEVEIFKDFYISKHLLSTLKTTNKLVSITAGIFAEENGYQNCLLINDDKNIVEATQSNIFLVKGNTVATPKSEDGCLNGIMRKQIIQLIEKSDNLTLEERSISPFELQKADELFLTNTIQGIQPITKYRKKEFQTNISTQLLGKLNAKIRFGQ